MKGITDYYGKDRLHYLLFNNGGTGDREAAMADERIDRYEMQGFSRIRMDPEEAARASVSAFGHFSYGYIVIGSDGLLKGINVPDHERHALVADAVNGDSADPDDLEDQDFAIVTAVSDKQGGRPLWNIADKLPAPMTATLELTLTLPDGWHVYGAAAANPEPTRLEVRHAGGLVPGQAVLPAGKGAPGGASHIYGPVKIKVPIEASKGTPIGNYLVHGVVRFMACNAERCLPPMELPWTARVDVF